MSFIWPEMLWLLLVVVIAALEWRRARKLS